MSGIERAADTVANSVVFIGSVLGAIITMDKDAMEKLIDGSDNGAYKSFISKGEEKWK